jgi:hypothetical protein
MATAIVNRGNRPVGVLPADASRPGSGLALPRFGIDPAPRPEETSKQPEQKGILSRLLAWNLPLRLAYTAVLSNLFGATSLLLSTFLPIPAKPAVPLKPATEMTAPAQTAPKPAEKPFLLKVVQLDALEGVTPENIEALKKFLKDMGLTSIAFGIGISCLANMGAAYRAKQPSFTLGEVALLGISPLLIIDSVQVCCTPAMPTWWPTAMKSSRARRLGSLTWLT